MKLSKSHRKLGLLVVLLTATFAPVSRVAAQSQSFTPNLKLDSSGRFNDNLLLSPKSPQADFSAVVSPTVGFLYGQPNRTYLGIDYTAELERFDTLQQYDADNEFVTLDAQAQFDRLTMRLAHAFRDVAGPNSEISMWGREQRNTTTFNNEYKLNTKTSLGLAYHQLINSYLTKGKVDYQEFTVSGTLYYHLFPKTDLFSEINQGWVQMQRGANAMYEEVNVGFRGKITSKITGTAKVGYQHREFTWSTVPNWDAAVASIALEARLSTRSYLDLVLARAIEPSGIQLNDSYLLTEFSLYGHYRLFRTVELVGGGSYSDREYKATPAGLALNTWGARIGVSYDLTKWIQLSALYRYRNADYASLDTTASQKFVSLNVVIHY